MNALRRLALLALLALPLAAAQAATTLDEEIRGLKLAEGEGFVLLKTVNPKHLLGKTTPNWMGLRVQREGEAKENLVVNVADFEGDHALFFGKLPAGRYTMRNLMVLIPKQTFTGNTSTYSSETFLLPLGDPAFEVKAGTVSDLGAAIALPADVAKVLPSKYEVRTATPTQMIWTHSDPESARVMSLLRARQPDLKALTKAEAWVSLPQASTSQLSVLLPRLKELGASAVVDANGTIYTGEALGHVRALARDGSSQWLATGLTGPVTAVGVGEDGTLVAGTSMGLLAVKGPTDTAWQAMPLPAEDSLPLAIAVGPQGLHVLVRRDKEVTLQFKASPTLTEPWSELKRFSISKLGYSHFDLQLTGDGISILEHASGWSNTTTLHRYDANKKAWAEAEVPTDWLKASGAATLTPEGQVVSAMGLRGNPQIMRVSVDHGKTWSAAPGPDNFQTVCMQSRTHGFASRFDLGPDKKHPTRTYELWGTEDGGLNWRAIGPAPGGFRRVVRLSDAVLVGVDLGGTLHRSTDNGKTWGEI